MGWLKIIAYFITSCKFFYSTNIVSTIVFITSGLFTLNPLLVSVFTRFGLLKTYGKMTSFTKLSFITIPDE